MPRRQLIVQVSPDLSSAAMSPAAFEREGLVLLLDEQVL